MRDRQLKEQTCASRVEHNSSTSTARHQYLGAVVLHQARTHQQNNQSELHLTMLWTEKMKVVIARLSGHLLVLERLPFLWVQTCNMMITLLAADNIFLVDFRGSKLGAKKIDTPCWCLLVQQAIFGTGSRLWLVKPKFPCRIPQGRFCQWHRFTKALT